MVVSICITLCVCCFYLFFFEKGWIWRDDNKKYCIILKKDIYIYTNFKGCQVDGKGCHSRLQTSPLFGGSSLTPALPQGYTMSLGMKKTKAQYALPHPYLGAYVIMCWVIRWFGANDCLSSKYGVRWVVSNSNIQGCWNIPFVSYCFTVLFILLMFNDVQWCSWACSPNLFLWGWSHQLDGEHIWSNPWMSHSCVQWILLRWIEVVTCCNIFLGLRFLDPHCARVVWHGNSWLTGLCCWFLSLSHFKKYWNIP